MTTNSEPGKVQALVTAAKHYTIHATDSNRCALIARSHAFSPEEIAAADAALAMRHAIDVQMQFQSIADELKARDQRVQELEAERDSLRDRLEAELLSVYRQRDRLREAGRAMYYAESIEDLFHAKRTWGALAAT